MLYIGTVSPFPNENVGWNSQIPWEKFLRPSIVDVFMVTFHKKKKKKKKKKKTNSFFEKKKKKKKKEKKKKLKILKKRAPKRVTYIILLQR